MVSLLDKNQVQGYIIPVESFRKEQPELQVKVCCSE